MNNNKTVRRILWLVLGIGLIVLSIAILVFTATDSRCQIGPAVCGDKTIAAGIGIVLGIIAILWFCYNLFNAKSDPKIHDKKIDYNKSFVFGRTITIVGVSMGIIGILNFFLKIHFSLYLGVAMIIFAIPIVLSGIIMMCYGKYHSKIAKLGQEREYHPVLFAIFTIGIITILLFLFF